MSKRKPTSELNDRNWDEEDEPEDAGTFRLAQQDVLKNRTIRKAKRTMHAESSNSGSIFAGFALKSSDSSIPKPSLSTGVTLNFGSNLTVQPKSNGTSQKPSESKKDPTDNAEYLRQLKVLNENILTWIQKHVGENPYCILTPSFKDYEKHLSDLEKKYPVGNSNNSQASASSVTSSADSGSKKDTPAPASIFSAGSKTLGAGFTFGQTPVTSESTTASKSDDTATTKSGFSFGAGGFGSSGLATQSTGALGSSSTGGFGSSSLTQSTGGFGSSSLTQSTGGFGSSSLTQSTGGFGSGSTPFSFGLAAKPAADSSTSTTQSSGAAKGEEDEEYQPPKAEVREIKEDGSVYTKRCKLFYQKEGQWTERGVGNLHLKPTDDQRTQLVIRADTNLGNILLNIILSPSIPTKRQGKNNVFMVCVLNPPVNPKEPSSDPTPMLIRVKTSDDADELLAKLDELKA